MFQDLTAKRKEREEFKKDLVTQLQHTNYESLRLVCDARNIPGVFYEYLGSNIEVRSIADCGSSSRALYGRPHLAKPPSGQVQRLWHCICGCPPAAEDDLSSPLPAFGLAKPALGCTTVGKDVPKNFWYFLRSENTPQKESRKSFRKLRAVASPGRKLAMLTPQATTYHPNRRR